MKHFYKASQLSYLVLLTILITLVACSKDEAEKATNDLLGTWNIDGSTVDLTVDGEDLVTYMVDEFEYSQMEAEFAVNFFSAAMETENQGTINFKDDNTYTLVNSDGTENGTWSINSDGDILTLNYEGETDNLTILSLSASNMQIKVPTEKEQLDLDDDGTDETTVDIDIKLNMSK